jgi:glycosyltransferase involved in cell wall biosynthesis
MEQHLKTKVLFDIAVFVPDNVAGIGRVALEILKLLLQRNDLEIIMICSALDEQAAWRHLNKAIGSILPLRCKDAAYSELTEPLPLPPPPKETFLRNCENLVRRFLPKNKLLNTSIETVRKIKWLIKPPPPLPPEPKKKERPRSPILEQLCRNSDVYFSPFDLPVREVDSNPNLIKLLVIYDIIPFLYPDLYPREWLSGLPDYNKVTPDMSLFSISQQTKTDVLNFFPNISENQFTVIPLGADERFKPANVQSKIDSVLKKYKIPLDIPYILSVATLEVRKNFDHIIRCFENLHRKYENDNMVKDSVLVLTGQKGWLDSKIYNAYEQLPKQIKRKIIFTGYAADEDLPFLYNGAECFCYMSLYEGFGLPPLEAMQSGCPVIVSNTSSLPEVVGDAGILLPPKDKAGLVDAFYRVLTDEDLHKKMVAAGLEQAKKFNWDKCTEIILSKMKTGV